MLIVPSKNGTEYSGKRPSKESSRFKKSIEDLQDNVLDNEDVSGLHLETGDSLDEHVLTLRLKLNNLRYNRRQLPKRNFYFSEMNVLNDNLDKSPSKKPCPKCQLIYKTNNMIGQEVIPYISSNNKVEITI